MIDTRNLKFLVSRDFLKVLAGLNSQKIGPYDTLRALKARQRLSQSLQDAIRWLTLAFRRGC